MGLKGGTSKTGGLGKKIAEGVFGRKGRIRAVKQAFGKTLGKYTPDMYIDIEIETGGEYPDTISLFGNFSREQTGPDEYRGPIKGWGTAGDIDQFFQKLNVFEHLDESEQELDIEDSPITIPQSWIDGAVGCQVYYLLHASDVNPTTGKPYYNCFKTIVPVKEGTDEEADAAYQKIKAELYSDDYSFTKLQKGRDALDINEEYNEPSGTNVNKPVDAGGGVSLDDDLPI